MDRDRLSWARRLLERLAMLWTDRQPLGKGSESGPNGIDQHNGALKREEFHMAARFP